MTGLATRATGLVSIVLAAGAATRFGADKLSAPFHGQPLLAHAIRAARAAPVGRVLVVCRPGLDIGQWQGSPPVHPIAITSDGLSQSLAAGIAAASAAGADGAFVFLGDMPLIPYGVATAIAPRLGQHFAVQPQCAGTPGHPVLLSQRAFAEVAALIGDEGAGRLLRGRADVLRIEMTEPGCTLDVDHSGDIALLEARGAPHLPPAED